MSMDFESWVRANIAISQEHGDGEVTATCPRCQRPKLALNLEKGAWQCWTCHYRGRRRDALVEEVTGEASTLFSRSSQHGANPRYLTIGEALSGTAGGQESLKSPKSYYPKAPLPSRLSSDLSIMQKNYLKSRKVPDLHKRLFQVGVCSDNGTKAGWLLSSRIIIPVISATNTVIYWTARALLSTTKPKTLNCPSVEKLKEWGLSAPEGLARKSDVLLGLHLVTRGDAVVLVEGPMDALVCGAGFVATLGAGLSEAQANLLIERRVSEVIVMFDPDDAGNAGVDTVVSRLGGLLPIRVAICPEDSDPADMGREAALKLAQGAETLTIPKIVRPKKRSNEGGLRRRKNFIPPLCQ